jgi:hypothetical protein
MAIEKIPTVFVIGHHLTLGVAVTLLSEGRFIQFIGCRINYYPY